MGAAGDAAIGRESRELMSAADVGRTISRIAHQIIEKTALDDQSDPTRRGWCCWESRPVA